MFKNARIFVLLLLPPAAAAMLREQTLAADWIAAPGDFSHDPYTGQRVTQYAPIPPVYQSNYSKSVYRHTRSSLQVQDSIDNYHLVETYGGQVRPYGEWQYPYRPFSTPYPYWGPQFGGGYGYGGGGFGGAYGGGAYGAFGAGGPYAVHQPFFTGNHPDVRRGFPFPNPRDVFGGGAPINNDIIIGDGNQGNLNVDNGGGIRVPGNGNNVVVPQP